MIKMLKQNRAFLGSILEDDKISKPCVIGSVGFPILALDVAIQAVSF